MKLRDIIIAFIVLVAIIAAVLVIKGKIKVNKLQVPTATPTIQQKIQNKFQGLVLPQNVESIELKDVSGGEGMGIATRSEIIADLLNPSKGQVYQGWLSDSSGKTVLLGTLANAKGGWILNYDSSKYPGFNKVVIMLEKTRVLEGSF